MTEPEETPVEPQAAPTPAPETETVKGEPFDAARAMATIEKLRAEIKELKPKARQAEELSAAEAKRKEAEMTDLQKAQAELEKAQAELSAYKITEMKRAAAIKFEIPLAFADRIQGITQEEIEKDAEAFAKALPKAPKPPSVSPTSPSGASTGETLEQQRARIHGLNGASVFDVEFAKAHGGGVILNDKPLTP